MSDASKNGDRLQYGSYNKQLRTPRRLLRSIATAYTPTFSHIYLSTMKISLLSLPPELILEIGDFLPPDGILALKLAHRYFNETLPFLPRRKNTVFSDCAKLAIRYYLTPPNPEPSHLRCILCKEVYPIRQFRSSSSPACVSDTLEDASHGEVVELPQRMCSWHVGRLSQVVHTAPGGRNEWTSAMGDLCMHCGAVQAWKRCDCECGSCGIRPVRTYTRYLNNDHECRQFVFWRAEQQLMVREECRDLGE